MIKKNLLLKCGKISENFCNFAPLNGIIFLQPMKSLKNLFFVLAVLTFAVGSVKGQMVRYPFQSLIKKGEYQEAKTNIEKELKKKKTAVGLNYAAFKLFADKGFEEFNRRKAYGFLEQAWRSFETAESAEKEWAMKNGLSNEVFEVNVRFVCKEILEELMNENPENTEAAMDTFLTVCKRAPEDLRREAEKRRDEARRSRVEGQGTEDKGQGLKKLCELLVSKPKGDWVNEEREKVWKAACSGEDLDVTECAVSLFDGEKREKLLGVLHGRYVERSVKDADVLYEKFKDVKSPTLNMHRERDEEMKRALNNGNLGLKEKIRVLAPYNQGVVLMAQLADSLRSKEGWSDERVFKELDEFKTSYGGNRWFRNLLMCLGNKGQGTKDNGQGTKDEFAGVNTKEGREYSPTVGANDSVLFFVGRGRRDSLGGEDIYMARRLKSGEWGEVKRLNSLNTAKGNEAVEAVTVDGEEMILFKNGRLFSARRYGQSWGKTVAMEGLNVSDWQADAVVTSDGNAVLFAARTRTGREVKESMNIYVAVRDSSGKWSSPIELGGTINTALDDRAPFLHPDMKTLYFSSKGHGGLGGYDVWMSRRKSDKSWTEWTEPVNVGRCVNTAGDECWYKISTDGRRAYYAKTTKEGHEDLFSAELPASVRPEPVAVVRGRIRNGEGGRLSCKIKWEDLETGEVMGSVNSSSVDGGYFAVLPLGRRYGYFVEKEGYYPIANWVDLKNEKNGITVERDMEMVSIEEMLDKKAAVPLNNLFFESGKSELLPESRFELDRVVMLINSVKVKIEISGYTDNQGDAESNQRLSEDRCRAVRDYLIDRGCDYYRFTIIGYGQERPRATNDTPEGRQLNRRVELRLVK